MTSVKTALAEGTRALVASDSARLDAEILLSQAMQKNRTWLYTHPEAILNDSEILTFQQLISQRESGIPIAYLTKTRSFWSLELAVSEDTLIPRPETELLVELALSLLAEDVEQHLLDLGTGSGAIALACAADRPHWHITALDINPRALHIARANALRLSIGNVDFMQSNWFDALPATLFDAILSNPPYLAESDPHLLKGDVRFEPKLALVSGEKGLDAIQQIIEQSLARLKPNGLLLIEHGFEQKTAVRSMLRDYGYKKVQCWQDWQGNDRISGGWKG
ncbi:MAG: peptide chain release factor N(5)-glutamine methyltransferase [Tatlockia sp.]|jgi:release factor glutamine methyltransferase